MNRFDFMVGYGAMYSYVHQELSSSGEYVYYEEAPVARCVIGMKLGDEFEVPDELGVMG